MSQWFYALADGRQQAGPVEDPALADLVRAGRVGAGTLVWRRGMPAWQPYAEVWTALQATPVGAGDGNGNSVADPTALATAAANWTRCVDCFGFFAVDDTVMLHEGPVCARCKPFSLQRLREGVPARTTERFAGFWIRVGAYMLDYFIKLPVQILAQVLTTFLPMAFPDRGGLAVASVVLLLVLNLGFELGYDIFFTGRFAATPGKMVCGLRVVRSDGSKVTYGRAAGRVLGKWLSGLTLGIGYLMVGFDEQRRALHDHLADTRVVFK